MDAKSLTLELVPFDQHPPATAANDAPLEIEILPLDLHPPVRMAPRPAPQPPSTPAPAAVPDPCLQEAIRQHEQGELDVPLWEHALAHANGDKEAATLAYQRARATVLRLAERDLQAGRRATARAATRQAADHAGKGAPAAGTEPAAKRRPASPRHETWKIGAAAVAVLLAAAGMLAVYLTGSPGDAAGAPQAVAAGIRPAIRGDGATVAPAKVPAANVAAVPPEFLNKIQELSDAGNWNVLVLYAVEWTRKEPANAAAWDRLRAGYVNLRQYDDALGAAKKAAQLAPQDARMWRNLGLVNLELDDAAALRAFEQAVATDPQDLDSLKQVGILNARLGRMKEATVAFNEVLAISPDDAGARCLRAAAAQAGATPQDAGALARQTRSFDPKCQGVSATSAR